MARVELAAQYEEANYRRAALIRTLLDLAVAEQSADPADIVARARLVDRTLRANLQASTLQDPRAIALVAVSSPTAISTARQRRPRRVPGTCVVLILPAPVQ